MRLTAIICQLVTAFVFGFLFVVMLANQRSPFPEERLLEQGYGITGIITNVDTANSHLTVRSFDTTNAVPTEKPVDVILTVRAESILTAQDFIMKNGSATGLTPQRTINLSELHTGVIAFVHFVDTANGLVVRELLIGEPVPVFNTVMPILQEMKTRAPENQPTESAPLPQPSVSS